MGSAYILEAEPEDFLMCWLYGDRAREAPRTSGLSNELNGKIMSILNTGFP